MNIAIILARGGSKRIPGKNIKEFCGKPIISYSIEAALGSKLFNEVMVSTDDEKIAETARRYGASVPFLRSTATSGDFATTAEVLLEVITEYKNRDMEFNNVCCIYPTAPFVTSMKLCSAMNVFESSGADALVPIVPFSYPPLRGVEIIKDRLRMRWPEYYAARSQDLPTLYHDIGQFYFVQVDALLREETLFCANTVPMIIPEMESQDIDNVDDWKLAELKYKLLNEKR